MMLLILWHILIGAQRLVFSTYLSRFYGINKISENKQKKIIKLGKVYFQFLTCPEKNENPFYFIGQ